jgi:hypothetical protein
MATILIFTAYGKAKGNGDLKFSAKTITPLILFLIGLLVISIDDVSQVFNLGLTFPEVYWIVAMWFYPIISFFAFFSFGEANENRVRLLERTQGS